jgi:hypothetical protein
LEKVAKNIDTLIKFLKMLKGLNMLKATKEVNGKIAQESPAHLE